VPRGKPTHLTPEQQRKVKQLTFSAAQDAFHIGYAKWKAIREAEGYLPFKGGNSPSAEVEERTLDSVRAAPHLSARRRAHALGLSHGTVQKVAKLHGLGRLNARLEFAGYRVEVCQPLAVARQRRIVATYPGSLTHIDFKTFGYVRPPWGGRKQKGRRLGGFVVVDSLTAYAHLELASVPDAENACNALDHYCEKAPFRVRGLLLSDNGKCFLAQEFIELCVKLKLLQRTTKTNRPWSNGKVEALNKTLKYQCFPAIANNVQSWESAENLVEEWMNYYNHVRAHGGHCNQGLPPVPFAELYEKTPGDHLAKLINLGIVKLDDEWSVRLMGGDGKLRAQSEGEDTPSALPFALVMQRKAPRLQFDPDMRELGAAPSAVPPPPEDGPSGSRVVLAK